MPKTGVGVGGGTLAWLGVCRGFIRADFRTATTEGVGDDWPIGYDDLRPYYEQVEREFGVAGECGPFAPEPYELPMPPHRMNWHAQVLARGARALGAHPFAPPVAINSVAVRRAAGVHLLRLVRLGLSDRREGDRGEHVPRPRRAPGAQVISEAFVHRVNYDADAQSRHGRRVPRRERRASIAWRRRVVVLAAHAIETPRLLLLLGQRRLSRRPGQLERPGRPATS